MGFPQARGPSLGCDRRVAGKRAQDPFSAEIPQNRTWAERRASRGRQIPHAAAGKAIPQGFHRGHMKIPGWIPGISMGFPSFGRFRPPHSALPPPFAPKTPFSTRDLMRSAQAALLSSLTGAEYLTRFAAHSK